jgi:L-asparaginase/Glu-tRNA(Gln) amidotransferase subunit D
MDERILLIQTGGTFDSEPYADPRNPPEFVATLKGADSLMMPTINTLPNHEYIDGFTWGTSQEDRFIKDSKYFTPDDIDYLADIIRHDDNHRLFVITHGTDAMVKNAMMLQETLADTDKVVVFAGAMVPLSMHKKYESDGVNALRFSLEHIASQKSGVYVLGCDAHTKRMTFFDPHEVQKDREKSIEDLRFTLKSNSLQRA